MKLRTRICARAALMMVLAIALTAGFAGSGSAQSQPAAGGTASKAATEAQVYRNSEFGFRYQIPYGWVERTQEMREQVTVGNAEPKTEKSGGKNKESAAKNEVLLAIFERPPAAPGDSVNSAVVIAKESAAAYPGLKTAEDYLAPLAELTTSKGFKANGDPSGLTIDGRELVRGDFTKPLTDKLSMYQTTLALVAKGQIVSFTFIGSSEDEVDELIEKLGFARGRAR